MFYQVFTSATCFPLPITLNGVFSSIGTKVTTNVVSTLQVGDYLYSTSNNEVRKVISIQTVSTYTLERAFTVDVISDSIKIADKSVVYTKISIANLDKVDGVLNGNILFKRSIVDIDNSITPFTLDGTGTFLSVLAT